MPAENIEPMKPDLRGRYFRPTTGRILVDELMRHSHNVPLVAVQRAMNIKPAIDARNQSDPKISWVAIFAKAYSVAALQIPQLRHAWVRFPWARIYEHPHSEAAIIVEREYEGEKCVFTSTIRSPEATALQKINGHIRRFRDAPVWEVSSFRALIRLTRLPAYLRWVFLVWYLRWVARKKCKRFGTFAISSLGDHGAELITPVLPLTAYLTYGPISPEGDVVVRLIFDHRVMDGRHAAKALIEVEKAINGQLVAEMRSPPKIEDA